MRSWGCVVLTVAIGVGLAGCARKDAKVRNAPSPPGVVLPEWAPKNPSPEFLRAERVLKPLPPEMLKSLGGRAQVPDLVLKRYVGIFPAAYEFFGTLTDEQIGRFRTTGRIRIRVGELTQEQRSAFDRFVEARNRALEADMLVAFYKLGATKDLSNMEIGFLDEGGHIVSIRWWVVTQEDPEARLHTGGDAFAMR